MRRLLFKSERKPITHELAAGDFCMALPASGQRAVDEPCKRYLATVVNFSKRQVVFFDDGSEQTTEVENMLPASSSDRDTARAMYSASLDEMKDLAAQDPEEVVRNAIETVRASMGGTLGDDGMISYTKAAGVEAREGELLCSALLSKIGGLAQQSPALRWMRSEWQETCARHDVDASGTISETEAAALWAEVRLEISCLIAAKLERLGAPPRLYKGDLCVARPAEVPAERGLELATYCDERHVQFLDGKPGVSAAIAIAPASNAAKEAAIMRYTMAVSQLKALARKPSRQLVGDAIAAVRKQVGGTLRAGAEISYTDDAGDGGREGELLCAALFAHLGALKGLHRAIDALTTEWKVACARADADGSGTISHREAVVIWDRLVVESMRAVTGALDKLGVYPLPLLLEKGDLCMIKPLPADAASADPSRLYLGFYVDPSHATYFDDPRGEVVQVASLGPATQADREVATVKYLTALEQCERLAAYDEEGVVAEAIAEVRAARGGSLGADGKIDYTEAAGEEAREGELLVEALLSHVGALWDESRALVRMRECWRQTCADVDDDASGTISEDEAEAIWACVLAAFRSLVLEKLQALGAVQKQEPLDA